MVKKSNDQDFVLRTRYILTLFGFKKYFFIVGEAIFFLQKRDRLFLPLLFSFFPSLACSTPPTLRHKSFFHGVCVYACVCVCVVSKCKIFLYIYTCMYFAEGIVSRVMRKSPFGQLLRGANDVAREHRFVFFYGGVAQINIAPLCKYVYF